MGIRNVNAVFVYWSHLPDRPFRVLLHMCAIANDETRRYYGGHDMLARGLGLTFPPLPHHSEVEPDEYEAIKAERDLSMRKVRRAIQVLTDARVVRLENSPRTGERAEYTVCPFIGPEQVTQRPTDIPESVDNSKGEQVTQRPTKQVTQRPPSRSLSDRRVGHSVTSQPLHNHYQPELHQENSSPLPTQVSAREGSDEKPMSHFQVKEVLDAAAAEGSNVTGLIASAPESLTKKSDRRAWAAQQILATKEAS